MLEVIFECFLFLFYCFVSFLLLSSCFHYHRLRVAVVEQKKEDANSHAGNPDYDNPIKDEPPFGTPPDAVRLLHDH